MSVTIDNADKVFFADAGMTRDDLAGRPLTRNRFPDV